MLNDYHFITNWRVRGSVKEVMHILGANKVDPHPYTSAARIVDGELSYRPESLS